MTPKLGKGHTVLPPENFVSEADDMRSVNCGVFNENNYTVVGDFLFLLI